MKCVECGSEKVTYHGYKVTRKGRKRRAQCQNCGRTFYPSEVLAK